MSDTAVSLLTAPGTGAIATVEVRGPRAWELARRLFAPAGKPLPDLPEVNRFWFGTLAGDEVVLAATAPDAVEVHCHGGPRVVQMVMAAFEASGGRQPPVRSHEEENRGLTPPARLLERAPTLRTANIILDQLNGAFVTEVRDILAQMATNWWDQWPRIGALAARGSTAGAHLVEPWKVVIAGAPNVGKSSLINALAGYQRAVVSEVAGTTRDAVSVRTAFDGWPVELIDTAGVREVAGLEAEGVRLAHRAMRAADILVWVVDATDPGAHFPDVFGGLPREVFVVFAANKCDQPHAFDLSTLPFPSEQRSVPTIPVSAHTGAGLGELIRAIIRPHLDLPPGIAVPYTPRLIRLLMTASSRMPYGCHTEAAEALREALAIAEAHTAGPSALPSNP
ncbi:MAG: GTP-binding protein [Planctomycetes bacterium]|nr:GTP-binding protein [Planctomycetota bacterium]